MKRLKNKPQASNFTIEPTSLVKVLKANNGSMSILEILMKLDIVKDPSDMSSSKRAILRKARKGWTTDDPALIVNGKSYWTYIDGKTQVEVDGHSYTTGIVRLLDEKEAKENGYI